MSENGITYRSSGDIKELAAAMAEAQGVIGGASKDSANPYFRSKYADLASVWEAIRKPLATHGLAVLQPVSVAGSSVTVTTILTHASGQWISSDLTMTAQRQLKDGGGWEKLDTPQAVGSVITYARRYALAAMVGVAPEDDDAEAAQGRGQQRERYEPAHERRQYTPAQEEVLRSKGVEPPPPEPKISRDDFARLRTEFLSYGTAGQSEYDRVVQEFGAEAGATVPPTAKRAAGAYAKLLKVLADLKALNFQASDEDVPEIIGTAVK